MIPPDWTDWYRLSRCPGLARRKAAAALLQEPDPRRVLQIHAPSGALKSASQRWAGVADEIERTRQWLQQPSAAAGASRRLWTWDSPDYPAPLRDLDDPPLLLFVEGCSAAWPRRRIAMVGSRDATPQGLDIALSLARGLRAKGYCILSGMAMGIDAQAHKGALAGSQSAPSDLSSPGPSTIAVLGHGPDRLYPSSNHSLWLQCMSDGWSISEWCPGTPALARHFPERNRLIAALSQGVVVVEAALPSGSLVTARQALELGREVMAVPGSILSPLSKGGHALIQQGAMLVQNVDDVLAALGEHCALDRAPGAASQAESGQRDIAGLDPAESAIITQMGWDPVPVESLAQRAGWPMPAFQAAIWRLEQAGRVARLPGARVQRRR